MDPFDPNTATPAECFAHARAHGLGSSNQADRERAESAIKEMGETGVPFLLAVLEASNSVERRYRFTGLGVRFVGVVIVNGLLTLFAHRIGVGTDWRFGLAILSIMLTFSVCAALIIGQDWDTPRATRKLLREVADVRAINSLLECQHETSEWRSTAETAAVISKLLNQAKASDAPHFSDASRRRLVAVLSRIASGEGAFTRADIEYDLAVLHCLEQIGEPRALAAVQKISRGTNLSSFALPIRNAAREALPSFERAAEADRIPGTLLRPTASPSAELGLLRPAGSPASDSETLLLAVSPSDAD